MKVVNDDDQNGSNCIMTAGYNEEDGTDKQCSDPLKSSKRFKLKGDKTAVLDIVFDVIPGTTGPYKMLHKYSDYTNVNWDELAIELAFTLADGTFQKSTADYGLGFSDSSDNVYTSAITSYQSKSDVLSGYFSQGLAGSADKHHPDTGYFDPTSRMSYGLIATEDDIISDGLSSNYLDLFGPLNTIYNVPFAYFWDDDDDPDTDDLLMANCQGEFVVTDKATESGHCAGQWMTYRAYAGLDENGVVGESTDVAVAVDDEMIADWDSNSRYHTGAIEDLANLGLTYWLKMDDTSNWPDQSFTVRFTPAAAPADEICGTPIAEICTDDFDNDGDSYTDCADPDCAGIGSCGPEGRQVTCRDGLDNDGDGAIDCEDSGCVNNNACRSSDDDFTPTPSYKNKKDGQHQGNR